MKKEEFTLLENVNEYCSDLIALYSSRFRFARNLSTLHLAELTSVAHSECSSGKPVKPPTQFLSEVKRVVSRKEWAQLHRLLEKWNSWSESQGKTLLRGNELEDLAMGLLWETLLITECKRLYDQIQKEISPMSTVD